MGVPLRLITRDATHDTTRRPGATRTDAVGPEDEVGAAIQCVWEHWRLLLRHGRPVANVVTPARRELIRRALVDWGFEADALQLAVEGCAGSAYHRGRNRIGRSFDDLSDILRDEATIEELAAKGQEARDAMRRHAQAQSSSRVESSVVRQGPSAEVLQRLADLREALAKRAGVR